MSTKNKKLVYVSVAAVIFVVCALVVWQEFSKSSGAISHSLNASPGESSSENDGNAIPVYDFSDAANHIGEKATVKGTVVKVFSSKGGVSFFDYCKSSTKCPFSAVIFASDLDKFGDVSKYERSLEVTGVIKSYQGKAEIVLNDPEQIR